MAVSLTGRHAVETSVGRGHSKEIVPSKKPTVTPVTPVAASARRSTVNVAGGAGESTGRAVGVDDREFCNQHEAGYDECRESGKVGDQRVTVGGGERNGSLSGHWPRPKVHDDFNHQLELPQLGRLSRGFEHVKHQGRVERRPAHMPAFQAPFERHRLTCRDRAGEPQYGHDCQREAELRNCDVSCFLSFWSAIEWRDIVDRADRAPREMPGR